MRFPGQYLLRQCPHSKVDPIYCPNARPTLRRNSHGTFSPIRTEPQKMKRAKHLAPGAAFRDSRSIRLCMILHGDTPATPERGETSKYALQSGNPRKLSSQNWVEQCDSQTSRIPPRGYNTHRETRGNQTAPFPIWMSPSFTFGPAE